jgi:protein-S-isoprenylcysteine O-methyltransferase Ste14
MSHVTAPPVAPPTLVGSDLRRAILRRFAQIVGQQVVVAILLFASAGTWAWPRAWLYLGLSVLLLAGIGAWVLPRNPEIVAERGRRHRGTRAFDKVVLAFYTAFIVLCYVVCGLDAVRFASAPLSWAWVLPGALLIAGGTVPIAAAMAVNRHLEQTVRIQADRGHEVVTNGPYRYVRHPMYLGLLPSFVGIPLLLGSAWGLVPAAACMATILVRTALEDRMLRRSLPAYDEYARRTRYRLFPGVW